MGVSRGAGVAGAGAGGEGAGAVGRWGSTLKGGDVIPLTEGMLVMVLMVLMLMSGIVSLTQAAGCCTEGERRS